jgi:GT2 family glycosyltransferase
MTNIAILIPSFNNADTIGPTLDSVQAQRTGLACISAVYLADDWSQDNTIAVAEASWRAAIPLRVLKAQRNQGQWENVNRAMELAVRESVDWVLLLHSDDIAKPNWLQMMVSRMEGCSQSVGSICSSWDTFLPDGSVIPGENNPSRPVEVIAGNTRAVRGTLLRGCWWHISGCAIRVRAFEDIGGFDLKFAQMGDWEWLLRCLHRGWSIEYIPRTLILYRAHHGSVSSKSFKVDRDIRESLGIIRQYSSLLTSRELLFLHLRRGAFATRRMGRSLAQFQMHRCWISLLTLLLVVRNLTQCKNALSTVFRVG